MSRSEKSASLASAGAVLFLLSVADFAEGTWGEVALKTVAILFVLVLFVRMLVAKR